VPKLRVAKSGRPVATAPAAAPDDREGATETEPGSVANATPEDVGSARTTRRAATNAADVLNGDLRLDDFSFDFDDVEIPTEKLSDEDMKRHVDEFMARILD